MVVKAFLLLACILLIFPVVGKSDEVCQKWLVEAKISSSDKSCKKKCFGLLANMSTFYCPNQCELLCKPKLCEPSKYWKDKIKTGRPDGWENKNEKSKDWNESERTSVLGTLVRLPTKMKSVVFDGIYRMSKSNSLGNPGTTSFEGKIIVLYDLAFDSQVYSLERVIAHELGHIVYLNFEKNERKDYERTLKWNLNGVEKNLSKNFILQEECTNEKNKK